MSSVDHRLVEQLFGRAADLPADQRDAFLTTECGDNASLRNEIEDLLSRRANIDDDFLQSPFDNTSSDESDLKPGDTIGKKYKLGRVLGEGGLGVVWLAEQPRPVRRDVALKIVKLGMDSKEVVARFEAERNALTLMDHPSIAHIYDAGITDRGRPYFVMEYVHGVPITDFCDSEQLNTAERLQLFIEGGAFFFGVFCTNDWR